MASSSDLIGWPTQSVCSGASTMETELVGSRNTSKVPSGTRCRTIRSAAQRMVATVGMPKRSYTWARRES